MIALDLAVAQLLRGLALQHHGHAVLQGLIGGFENVVIDFNAGFAEKTLEHVVSPKSRNRVCGLRVVY
jgi:hypothetical protein